MLLLNVLVSFDLRLIALQAILGRNLTPANIHCASSASVYMYISVARKKALGMGSTRRKF